MKGEVLEIEGGVIRGRVWAGSERHAAPTIQVWRGDELIAQALAQPGDPALEDGGYSFSVDVTHRLASEPDVLEVFAAGDDVALTGGVIYMPGRGRDGVVDGPGYLDTPAAVSAIETTPYEHYAYEAVTLKAGRLGPRMINRLRRERSVHVAGLDLGTALLLQIGEAGSDAAWSLQSYPRTERLQAPSDPEACRAAVRDAGKVYFAGPGDVIHPSAAGITLRMTADVVTWHRFEPSEWRAGAPGRLYIYPPYDPVTARHGAASDTTLCVRGALLATAPDDVLRALAAGRLHPLYFWLSTQAAAWDHHPESLTIGAAPARSRHSLAADAAYYERAVLDEGVHTLVQVDDEEAPPFALLPLRRAARISVLICFKNFAEATLGCLRSIAAQRVSGEIEIVLVDNQSAPADAERVREGAVAMFGVERVQVLTYDRSFNHSAQNNLAARAASGDVLIICNNDILLSDPTALEQMAAWALVDGIGAVGCRLEDPLTQRGSHGHVITPALSNPYRVSVSENAEPTFGRYVHAVCGATFAFAAMARSRFLDLGGLDEVNFPIGYNDVEFMFRAARSGLRHIYLGHVHALHERGSSRTGDDEALQALRLNHVYAHELGQRRRFLAVDMVPVATAGGKGVSPPTPAILAKEVARAPAQETRRLAAIAQLDEIRKSVDDPRVHQVLTKMQALLFDR